MDEETRRFILAQIMKKQAFRDQRRRQRPSNYGFFQSLEWSDEQAESENRLFQKYLLNASGSPAP